MRAWALLVAAVVAGGPIPPPDPTKKLPVYKIDLDAPAAERWTQPVADRKGELKLMLGLLKDLFPKNTTKTIIDSLQPPEDFAEEMQGIASTLGVGYDDIVMGNMYYEISSLTGVLGWLNKSCTSIVAENINGSVYLARNQDYPPPFSVLLYNAQVYKGGKMLYQGTAFAGVIGVATAMAPGGWAVSIDARSSYSPTLEQALAVARAGGAVFPWITRQALEAPEVTDSFEAAVNYFATKPMILPGYLIVAGAHPGEGAVVTTNSSADNNDVWRLKDGYGGGWYLAETNYDHWAPAPLDDDRRWFVKHRMEEIGTGKVGLRDLWNVLSQGPVYNLATIHTELVEPATGDYQTYLRHNIIAEPAVVV